VISGLALVLAAPLCAQGVIYSPTHLDSKTEGQYYGYYLSGFSNARQQYGDGENRGKVAVIGAVNLRLDYRSHTTSTAQGRKWTNLKVSIAEGDVAKFGNTFASNMTSTPTVVFNSAWSLPTVTGYPLTSPAVYGGLKGEYKIPFTSTWIYTGKTDIVHDWQFSGGTMDNNVTWTGSSSRTYYFDSYTSATEFGSVGSSYRYIPSTRLNNNSAGVTTRCNDSAHTTTTGAYAYVYATLYGPKYPVINYRSNVYFYTVSYYTAFDAPVIHGLSFATNDTGVDIGTGCNKLHLSGPVILRPTVTMPRSYSSSGYSAYRQEFIPWDPAMANLKVTVQGAWTDSVTSQLGLTQAREATLPASLPKPAPKRMNLYQYSSPTAATGYGPYNYYYMNPAMAYTTK
jgi:hypothetical protein